MKVGGGPSRVIVPVDIVGINVPDPPRTINLEMSGDFPSATQMANLQRSYVVVGDEYLLRKIGIRRL